MNDFNFAIEVLSEKVRDIGGDLYALELIKKDKNGEAMASLFGGLIDSEDKTAQFKELLKAIKLLKEVTPPEEEK